MSVAVVAMMVATTFGVPTQYFEKLGITVKDVGQYQAAAKSIASCSEAGALDTEGATPRKDAGKWAHISNLYAKCRDDLKRRHAPASVLNVEHALLGFSCIKLGMMGGRADGCN